MSMYIREHDLLKNEIKDMLIADLALSFAFAVIFAGGIGSSITLLIYFFPMSLIAVSFSFILHEYMHKKAAQKYGAIAAFKKSDLGVLITLVSSLFGFLLGIPGATVIYTSTFTRKEEGIVSLAGPLTNFAVFAVFFLIGFTIFGNAFIPHLLVTFGRGILTLSYLQNVINTTLLISIILAFFNMLPIYPLDGSKVFRWNKLVYAATVLAIFMILLFIFPVTYLLFSFIFMLIIALFFSIFSSSVRLF